MTTVGKLISQESTMPKRPKASIHYRTVADIRRRYRHGERMSALTLDHSLPAAVISAIVRCWTIEGAVKVYAEWKEGQSE